MIHVWGYRYSVYSWIIRLALAERALDHSWTEVNPFDPGDANPHPFSRVPMIRHGDIRLYEVNAITTYIDAAFPGDSWTPDAALSQARMMQVIGIVDSYGYWPMVREVFAPAVFGPAVGETADPDLVAQGLRNSEPVLNALEEIAEEGEVLTGPMTRADLHLAPMIGYFTEHPPAAEMLTGYPNLSDWFERMRSRPSYVATKPELPNNRL